MSNTSGPMLPDNSGRLVDLFEPSRVIVTDRLAGALMRDVLILGAVGTPPPDRLDPTERASSCRHDGSGQNYGAMRRDATFAPAAERCLKKIPCGTAANATPNAAADAAPAPGGPARPDRHGSLCAMPEGFEAN